MTCYLENIRLFVPALALLAPSNNVGFVVPNYFQARDVETAEWFILGAGSRLRLLRGRSLGRYYYATRKLRQHGLDNF